MTSRANSPRHQISDATHVPAAFKTIRDSIPGLYVDAGKLFIKLKKRDAFLLHILASADFVVIPRSEINEITLEIHSRRNTTGPYYLESEDAKSAILARNPAHFRLTPGNAHMINCTKFRGSSQELIDAFKGGQIQHIPTASPISSAAYVELSKEPDTILHQTRDILLFFGSFTQRAREKYTAKQRFAISSLVQKAIQREIPKLTKYATLTEQFFHDDGIGSIRREELSAAKEVMQEGNAIDQSDVRGFPLVIEAIPSVIQIFRPILEKEFEHVEFVPISRISGRVFGSKADLIFASLDISLEEDFAGISFASEWGLFPLSEEGSRLWLASLSSEDDPHKRKREIEVLHLKALVSNPTIVPLYRLPVFAIAADGWKMDLPTLYVTERIWQIHRD